jgi:predicted dehydrogenase
VRNFLIKYKAAIIGTGRIGYLLQKDNKREQPASHSLALLKNKRINLVAGCDIDKERLKLWHKDYPNANIYNNYLELLERERPDIVVIAVDEISHCEVTLKVIDFKPRLIVLEKPVAPNLEAALKIKRAAEFKKVSILVNHERRYSKDYLTLKELLKNHKIGKIDSINASLWSGMKVWSNKSKADGSCLLIHDGTHLLDIIHYLFGFNLIDPIIDNFTVNKKNEILSLFLHYIIKKDKILNLEFNGQKDYFGFDLDIKGRHGRIIIGNGYFHVFNSTSSPYYTKFKSLIKNKKIKRPDKTCYFSNVVKNCVDFLDGNNKLLSTLNDGLKVIEDIYIIIDKLKKS